MPPDNQSTSQRRSRVPTTKQNDAVEPDGPEGTVETVLSHQELVRLRARLVRKYH